MLMLNLMLMLTIIRAVKCLYHNCLMLHHQGIKALHIAVKAQALLISLSPTTMQTIYHLLQTTMLQIMPITLIPMGIVEL